jgi:hypothetical protein
MAHAKRFLILLAVVLTLVLAAVPAQAGSGLNGDVFDDIGNVTWE